LPTPKNKPGRQPRGFHDPTSGRIGCIRSHSAHHEHWARWLEGLKAGRSIPVVFIMRDTHMGYCLVNHMRIPHNEHDRNRPPGLQSLQPPSPVLVHTQSRGIPVVFIMRDTHMGYCLVNSVFASHLSILSVKLCTSCVISRWGGARIIALGM
jgi:hypothetical protein